MAMTHTSQSHVTHINESWNPNESWHTHQQGFSHTSMSHGTQINGIWHTSLRCPDDGNDTHITESCHTHQ